MSFNDLIVEIPNVVSKELCDEIIERFEADDGKYQGITGGGENQNVKRSTDLHITNLDHWSDVDEKLYKATTEHFSEYLLTYSRIVGAAPEGNSLHDTGYQIQRTNPQEFYKWHHDYQTAPIHGYQPFINKNDMEVAVVRERLFTFILYLNDRTEYPEDGRTQFQNSGEVTSVIAEPGKLLLFPANQIYTHRGEVLENGVKYLLTGWICVYTTTGTTHANGDQQETVRQFVSDCSMDG